MNHQLYEYSFSLRKQRRRKLFTFFLFLIIILVVVNLTQTFLVFSVRQVSDSMEPDLPGQSVVFVTPLDKSPERGTVMLLKPRAEDSCSFWLRAADFFTRFFTAQQISLINTDYPTSPQFRRVVGLPGDTIRMKDFVLYIRPADEKHFLSEFELAEKAYNITFYTPPLDWDGAIGVKGSFDQFQLGEDEYFVLGDNRKGASDSRLWGAVTKESFCGRALLCYFPFSSLRLY